MERKVSGGLIGGLILIVGGILLLINQMLPDVWGQFFGNFFLLGLGLVFVVAGIVTRVVGWFIPGGILTGLGGGMALLASPWASRLPGEEGGWFLIVFAAGFLLIPILSAIFSHEAHWWPLIPAGIIGLVGLAVVFGGRYMDVLEWVGRLWPFALIITGVLVIWKMRRPSVEEPQEPVEKHA
jgi:hypothetical protein